MERLKLFRTQGKRVVKEDQFFLLCLISYCRNPKPDQVCKTKTKSMNETNIRRWFGGFAAALVIGGCSSNAAEIAYWKFEAQNLGADSSPNGLDLAVTDVTSSAEKDARAPGTGS